MKVLENKTRRLLAFTTIMLLMGTVALGLASTSIAARAASSSTGIIVPLYSYPTDSSWSAIISAKRAYPNVPIIAVVNPSSGPGAYQDPNYVQGIKNLQAAGIQVLGYVATAYTSDSLGSVEADVNLWHDLYTVNGIFFDEMSNVVGHESYYSMLSSYVHGLMPGSTTLGNPGTSVPGSYIGTMDIICIYETGGYPSLSFISYPGVNPSSLSLISYGVSLSTSFLESASNSVGWIYATDGNMPAPYGALPSYFDSEVSAISSIDQGKVAANSPTTTVNSVDVYGNPISGLWTTWSQNGNVLATGFTPSTFSGSSGSTYVVAVANYLNFVFCHWQDGSTTASRSVTPSGSQILTAYYSTTGSCPSSTAITFPVSIVSKSKTGAFIAGLYTTVSQNGSPLTSGFSPLVFTATSGDTYSITVSNYWPYTFSHWSDGSINPSIEVQPNQSMTLTAYYSVA